MMKAVSKLQIAAARTRKPISGHALKLFPYQGRLLPTTVVPLNLFASQMRSFSIITDPDGGKTPEAKPSTAAA